jgi:DNA-binding PadR family transcriptional regulator
MARRAETIELAVLGLLHEAPMHGYELRKRLNLMLGWGRVLSYGSLYPTLKKMLRASLIEESLSTKTPGTPVSKRPRITYQVTEAGTREFERLMSEVGPTAWEDDRYAAELQRHGVESVEREVAWLSGLINAERNGVPQQASTATAGVPSSKPPATPAAEQTQ